MEHPLHNCVLYLDGDLVIADKPAGLLAVPGRTLPDSLTTRLQAWLGEVHVVHRLDMDTSGVMVFARHKRALSHLARQFQQRQVDKLYLAECAGHPEGDRGTVDLPLRCDWPNRPRQKVDTEQGRPACTHWEVLERRRHSSLLRLIPETGRSHQLRVHMQALGHPLLGDPFYHPDPRSAPRLMLHAWQLSFAHPRTGQWMSFTSPVPPEFGMVNACSPSPDLQGAPS